VPGLKTNERPGTRAVLRHYHLSPSKARQVLDLIRDVDIERANEILAATERDAAIVISKLLASAVANAAHNDGLNPEELYVSACFADEGTTLKRWRPRARGRATRIRKRTSHITIIVSPLPEERLARRRAERAAAGGQRSRRVAESRRRADLAGRLSRRRQAQAAVAEAEAAEAAAAEAELDEVEDELIEDAATEQAAEDVVEAEAEELAAETDPDEVASEAAEEVATEDEPGDGDGEPTEEKKG
jgi:large subunit ribosomal protein L22